MRRINESRPDTVHTSAEQIELAVKAIEFVVHRTPLVERPSGALLKAPRSLFLGGC